MSRYFKIMELLEITDIEDDCSVCEQKISVN